MKKWKYHIGIVFFVAFFLVFFVVFFSPAFGGIRVVNFVPGSMVCRKSYIFILSVIIRYKSPYNTTAASYVTLGMADAVIVSAVFRHIFPLRHVNFKTRRG